MDRTSSTVAPARAEGIRWLRLWCQIWFNRTARCGSAGDGSPRTREVAQAMSGSQLALRTAVPGAQEVPAFGGRGQEAVLLVREVGVEGGPGHPRPPHDVGDSDGPVAGFRVPPRSPTAAAAPAGTRARPTAAGGSGRGAGQAFPRASGRAFPLAQCRSRAYSSWRSPKVRDRTYGKRLQLVPAGIGESACDSAGNRVRSAAWKASGAAAGRGDGSDDGPAGREAA